jgi:hypothetical protein
MYTILESSNDYPPIKKAKKQVFLTIKKGRMMMSLVTVTGGMCTNGAIKNQ